MTQKKQVPAAPIQTWRERIGAGADFPVHAPTDVESAMQAEIADLRAELAQQRQAAAAELGAMERMFFAAATDLGLINDALGLDSDDGGAEPILSAIDDLKAALHAPAESVLAALRDAHDALEGMSDSDIDHFEDDEEEREGAPAQYAARKVMEAIQIIERQTASHAQAETATDTVELTAEAKKEIGNAD